MDVIHAHTLLAADVTAPVEHTVTFLLALFCPGVVAPATAEQVTPVNAMRGQVADAVPGAKGARLRVGLAKIGRVLVVDQVAVRGRLEEGVLGPQGLHPAP